MYGLELEQKSHSRVLFTSFSLSLMALYLLFVSASLRILYFLLHSFQVTSQRNLA